jgi:hypothetical protein
MTMSRFIPVLLLATVCTALVCGALLLSGCNILGPIGLLVHGPEKMPRQYTLPQERSLVVFVDDRLSRLPRRPLRTTLADQITSKLLENKVSTTIIDSRAAEAAVQREKPTEPMSVTEIGRSVKADVVLHVMVDGFTLSPDGVTFSPQARVFVRLTDTAADARLWPEEDANLPASRRPKGYEVVVQPRTPSSKPPETASEMAQAEIDLAKIVGTAVAELFYDETVKDSSRINRGNVQ